MASPAPAHARAAAMSQRSPQRRHGRPAGRALMRGLFACAVAPMLVSGIAGGLVRAGVSAPDALSHALSAGCLGQAVAAHAFLMVCVFMGTVIGIERAVAVKHPLAFIGPLLSLSAGAALLVGLDAAARLLVLAGSLAFVAVNLVVIHRQAAAHTVLLGIGAACWLAGSALHAAGADPAAVIPSWLAFLVLTIAAERLEMTRLMRRRTGAAPALYATLGLLLLACAFSAFGGPVALTGALLYGASLILLALWLLCFDIARRTVRATGLSRYMAMCLLLGYAWLAVAGVAWIATTLGQPWRDAALHALALGFVFSMMLGHAPVILPAIARVKVAFGWFYYVPLALLHLSLLVRVLGPHVGRVTFPALSLGAAGNALAIAAFALTLVGSALAHLHRRAKPALPSLPPAPPSFLSHKTSPHHGPATEP